MVRKSHHAQWTVGSALNSRQTQRYDIVTPFVVSQSNHEHTLNR
jgi:hypothetical protein